MAEIVELRPGQQSETILAFIQRKEVATTKEVAYRFGLSMLGAGRKLGNLRRLGELVSAPTADRDGAVRMNEWRIASRPPATSK